LRIPQEIAQGNGVIQIGFVCCCPDAMIHWQPAEHPGKRFLVIHFTVGRLPFLSQIQHKPSLLPLQAFLLQRSEINCRYRNNAFTHYM
jgi:hypothetical protein